MIAAIAYPRLLRLGGGAAGELVDVLRALGIAKPLLATDPFFSGQESFARITAALDSASIAWAAFFGIVPDPTSVSVEACLQAIKDSGADGVVAIGGGSCMDTAKAAALLAKHGGKLIDYRAPRRVTENGLPVIAIPTTSGTGSEMTRYSIVTDSKTDDKMVLIGEGLIPTAALVDFELTLSAPKRLTANTGLDAFIHGFESFIGRNAHPYSRMLSERAMRLVANALPKVWQDSQNRAARADMAEGSFLAGAAFSCSGLGLVHSMSTPLSGIFHIPHGVALGMLLAEVTRFSMETAPTPYAQAARILGIASGGDDRADAQFLLAWLRNLLQTIEIPTPSGFGISAEAYRKAIPEMTAHTMKSSATGNNPRAPSAEETAALFESVWA